MEIIKVKGSYLRDLRNAKPSVVQKTIHPPKGSMAAIKVETQSLPPINTQITFSQYAAPFELSQHAGLNAVSMTIIPTEFNWAHQSSGDDSTIRHKKSLIAKPGDQKLCGSCWAISGAGIVGDNFVVSGLVDWIPNLSTTWSLACYPQAKCQGGNPALLFNNIAQGGIVSNHCIDYSWCTEDSVCNGSALKHFDEAQKHSAVSELNSKIPSCGCYYGDEHYMYFIDPSPKTIFIGAPGITPTNVAPLVKKHIYLNGPAMGGFIVFNNFMKGYFAKSEGGVYLERGIYDSNGDVTFDDNQATAANYKGSHAIAVIGWGIAKNILVDNGGKRADVPYWYCRNSWTQKWGDGGYFKMAMYPWNKISQFDKRVIIQDQTGARHQGGGLVLLNVSHAPDKKKLPQIQEQFLANKRMFPDEYYKTDPKTQPSSGGDVLKTILTIIGVLILIAILFVVGKKLWKWYKNRKPSRRSRRKATKKSSRKCKYGRGSDGYCKRKGSK